MNKVLAIIVTYNPTIDKLKILVDDLISQNTDIIIVDNQSSNSQELDGLTATYIKLLDQNYGIAYAQNIGIQQAVDQNYEFIIFFDQDSSISSDMIPNMLELYQNISQDYKIACLGPAYIDTKTGIMAPAIQIRGLKVNKINLDYKKIYTRSDHIISSGTLTRLDTLHKIGFMNDKLFIDFVDIEWGIRASNMGYSCFIANHIVMKHCIGDKSLRIPIINKYLNIHSNFRRYFILRNAIFLILYSELPINWKIIQAKRTLQYFLIFSIFISPRLENIRIFAVAFKDAVLKKMYKGSM